MKNIADNLNNSNNSSNLVVKQAYDYILDNASLRSVAKNYGISHITLRDNFLKRLISYDEELYKLVKEKMNKNRPSTVNDKEVKKRVVSACNLLLNEDLTIKEIAEILSTTEFTIYRDLTVRLPHIKNINKDICLKVKEILVRHSLNNLNNNNECENKKRRK